MIWNLLLWLALAYLAAIIIWRFAQSRRKTTAKKGSAAAPKPMDRLFGRGWIAPTTALLLAVVALIFLYYPSLSGSQWTPSEEIEIEHFIEAMSLYQQASTMVQSTKLIRNDWETVNALLQASQSEAEQISVPTLGRINPELPAMFQDKFLPGLRLGIYGLREFTTGPSKNKDTVVFPGKDNLEQSRGLLLDWNEWFAANRVEIMKKFE
jgi:hypothetical protein